MTFKVVYDTKAQKQLRKLDPQTRKTILKWISKNLEGTTNPRQHGKPLQANRTGEWRYRVGNYRILAEIHDDKIIIEVFTIDHRSVVYKIKR